MILTSKFNTKQLFSLLFFMLSISFFFPNVHVLSSHKMQLIYSLFLLILLMLFNRGKLNTNIYNILAYLILAFWVIYSLSTYFWAINTDSVITTTITYLFNLLIFYMITNICDDFKQSKRFLIFLYMILILYVLLAIWEITTWNHLSTSWLTQENVISFIPTGPFYNQNNFAWIITLLLPFLIFSLKFFKHSVLHILSSLLLLTILVIFIIQGARIAIVIMLLELLIFLIFFVKLKTKLSIILALILLVIYVNGKFPMEFNLFTDNIKESFESLGKEKESYRMESMETRVLLIRYAIEMCSESFLFGVGSGNFIDNINYDKVILTSGIKDAHNFMFELLATNGFLLVLIFLISILVISFKLINRARITEDRNKYLFFAAGISLFFFFPASMMPSSILQYHCHWVVLAYIYSLYVISSKKSDIITK